MVVRPVVPDRDGVLHPHSSVPRARAVGVITHLLPPEADLQVVVELDEVEEVLKDRVGLVLGHADNALGEVWVHEDRLPARDGVGAGR